MLKNTLILCQKLLKGHYFEKMEAEYDIAAAESAYQEYVDSGRKSAPVQDFWRELDEKV